VNKAELVAALESRLGSKKAAAEALEAIVDTIQRTVARGEKVAISGFGSFEKAARGPRVGRNPRTGATVKIKKTSVPRFKPGTAFKGYVADPKSLPKGAAAKTSVRAAAATARTAAKAVPTPARATKAPATRAAATKAPAAKATTTRAPRTTATKAPAAKATTTRAPRATAAKAPVPLHESARRPPQAMRRGPGGQGTPRGPRTAAKAPATRLRRRTGGQGDATRALDDGSQGARREGDDHAALGRRRSRRPSQEALRPACAKKA
jgi:DNA-binding protein HU-beta